MNHAGNKPYFGIPTVVVAAASVPVTKVGLMFAEYQLHLSVSPLIYVVALLLALGAASSLVALGAKSSVAKAARIIGIVAWSALAYLLVAFIPGCLWAPACW